MAKNDLTKQCRYYNGEKVNPFTGDDNMAWFWDMERVYVESDGEFKGEEDYYKGIEGKDFPGIPHVLLIVMFTSWGKTATDINGNIEQFYSLVENYLFVANDHYPEDKIPG